MPRRTVPCPEPWAAHCRATSAVIPRRRNGSRCSKLLQARLLLHRVLIAVWTSPLAAIDGIVCTNGKSWVTSPTCRRPGSRCQSRLGVCRNHR
jgi:hypothetical protein